MQLDTLSVLSVLGCWTLINQTLFFYHNLLKLYYMLGVDTFMYYSCNNAYYFNRLISVALCMIIRTLSVALMNVLA